MQPFPNCLDFFPLFILPTPTQISHSCPALFRRTALINNFSWAKLCLTAGKRQQLLFWNKLWCGTWHLHSCFMMSPTSSSEQDPLRKQDLWAITCDPYLHRYLLYCQPFLQSIVCSSIQKNAKTHFLGCQAFLMVCTCITQATASGKHTAWETAVTCFPECFRLYHSRLTPQYTIQSSDYPNIWLHHQESQFHCHQVEIKCTMNKVLKNCTKTHYIEEDSHPQCR